MPEAQPSVISSMLRVIWVTSVTPSKSMEGRESPASQRAAMPSSNESYNLADRHSTARDANANHMFRRNLPPVSNSA